jgi:PhnB protein
MEGIMARVNTYLNFARNTEEAFNFYKSVFGGKFVGGISRMAGVPPKTGQPPLKKKIKTLSCMLLCLF